MASRETTPRLLTSLRSSFNQAVVDQAAVDRAPTRPVVITPRAVARDADPVLGARTVARWQRAMVGRLLMLDLLAAATAMIVAVAVRFGSALSVPYLVVALASPLVWVMTCASVRAYELRFLGTGSEEFQRIFNAGVRLLALTGVVSVALRLEPARTFLLIALPGTVFLTLVLRYAARQHLHRLREQGRCLHKVIVVGRERSCAELVRQLRTETRAGFSVVGACIDRAQSPTVEGVPVIGTSTTIVQALERSGADTVAVGAWSDLTQADLRRLSWQLEGSGVDLVVAPSLTDVAGPRIHIRPVSGLPLLHIEEPELSGGRRLLKGSIDRSLSLVALVLLSPLLVVIALAIRLTSRGPALFRQQRIGVDGGTFTMLKFRSMFVDAEHRLSDLRDQNDAADGVLFKMRDDPRVTPVGRRLRRLSLDELPQLINIVLGDMSIVGPRPPLPTEVEQYQRDVRRRLLVKPGLTGLWQISGRSDLSWEESVRLDLLYVENWSLALDASIVYKTVGAVLQSRGAY